MLGKQYDVRLKKIVCDKKVNKEELKRLWSEPKFIEFALKMRRLYSEKYPRSQLPPMPFHD